MKDKYPGIPLFLLINLLLITFCYCLPGRVAAQRTTMELGPFEPYGGRREVTYNKDSVPVELREYDILGNLRRHLRVRGDAQNRLTLMEEKLYDEEHHLAGGYRKQRTYKDSLDYGGKTMYETYDSLTKKFAIVKPLVNDYAQRMITAPPDSLRLDTFYRKYSSAFGIPIVSSAKV